MAASTDSASASASPLRALSKLRRNKGASTSQQSLNSSADDESTVQRSSVDHVVDKVKELTRDRGLSDASTRKRLSALVPERIRRTRRDDKREPQTTNSERDGITLSLSRSNSDSSMHLSDDTRGSSLYTVDYADEQGHPIRPPLSPHHSHTGYLTLSSPEISANTYPVASGASLTSLPGEPATDAIIPHIIEPSPSNESVNDNPTRDQAPDRLSGSSAFPRERSRSPARRLKRAFSLSRKKSSDDVGSVKSESALALDVPQTTSRRNSVEPSGSSKGTDTSTSPSIEAPGARLDGSSKDIPQTPQDRGRSTEAAAPPPAALDTPQTLVTPPTPTDTTFAFPAHQKTSTPPTTRNRALSSVESIRHRRAQSANLPSRLSNSIPAPLTPTIEEAKTPGGTLTQPTNATGGFFSSFFSAAQKAADQLNSSINVSVGQNKSKNANKDSPGQKTADDSGETQAGAAKESADSTEERNKAVYTLGTGNLSLSHLGISDKSASTMSTATELQEQTADSQQEFASRKIEEEAAARAVSVAYEKPIEKIVSQATGRPVSVSSNDRTTMNGDQTPPTTRTNTADVDSLKRSGSVRSKLSGRRRRHRNSSTNTSITAGLQSSATGLANLQATGPGHRLTGFAVASSKRNKEFHQLFRSVPEDDYLIEDYSAALQRDILLHGRLYVSEGHVCFSSNILGWVTNLVIGFDEIVSVEKKSTAFIFPNAIVIQTLHARNTFASFVTRDSTYELLIGIWKINHPNLKSSLNGVQLDNAGTGDKTEVAEPDASEAGSVDGSEDEVYDEDEDDAGSFSDAGRPASIAASEPASMPSFSRKPSASPLVGSGNHAGAVAVKSGSDGAEAATVAPVGKSDLIGPSVHSPTECGDAAEHYDRAILDTTIPAPLGKVYSLMWGPESSAFMRKWLVDEMKSRDLNYPDDKFGLDNSHKTVVIDYTKPLNAPIGPKQTRCITTSTLLVLDLEKSVSVDCSSSTPDVPSGSAFVTKTRYCLMWGPNNSTRLLATFTLEWSGKSWIKGAIEKGAQDGQTSYVKDLVTALKSAVSTKSAGKTTAKKGRRKGKSDLPNPEDVLAQRQASNVTEQKPPHWGPFEPLHPLLEPILDLVRPFITSQVVIAVMFVLLAYTWLVPPQGRTSVGVPGYASPDRLAAYEELWRREESDLWDWLEDRVGVDGIYAGHTPPDDRQRVLSSNTMSKKLDKERMKDRQVDDAIRTTEARLKALKDAVERKRLKR